MLEVGIRPIGSMTRSLSFVMLTTLALSSGCDDPKPAPVGSTASARGTSSAGATAAAPLPAPAQRHGGAIVRDRAETTLFVADEDRDTLWTLALPLKKGTVGKGHRVGSQPAQVVALEDRVLVTARDPGALVVFERTGGDLAMKAQVSLPTDAWGLAVSDDQKTAVVTSAWSSKVSGVDLESLTVRWTVDVPREPRGVVVVGERAYVSHLVGTALTRIDGVSGKAATAKPIELPAAPSQAPRGAALSASLGYALVPSPGGRFLHVGRHALGALASGWAMGFSWWGNVTVDGLRISDDTPLAPKRTGRVTRLTDYPEDGTYLERNAIDGKEAPLPAKGPLRAVVPRAMAYRASTDTLLVASEGHDRLVELDALALEPALFEVRGYDLAAEPQKLVQTPRRGGAPTGLALSKDEESAWVFCRSTYDVVHVTLDEETDAAKRLMVRLGPDPLLDGVDAKDPSHQFLAAAALGRRLFYNATDGIVSEDMSCSGCHPDGRDDAHVWLEADRGDRTTFVATLGVFDHNTEPKGFMIPAGDRQFRDRPRARQTPMLAGRVDAKGPYGWHAESEDLVARIKGGFGLHRNVGGGSTYGDGDLEMRARAIAAFLRKGLRPPARPERELTAEEKRGEELFSSKQTECATCHVPDSDYTDRVAVPLPLPTRSGLLDESKANFKTPSLRFVGTTSPYFHDGSVATLEQLIAGNNNRMGKTTHLSEADQRALVAFLRTL